MRIYYCEGLPREISQHSLAYLLLEAMLKKNYPGKVPENPEYERNPFGKPCLKDYPEIHFNISHCPAGVACVIGSKPVGIDMERRFPWKEKLARRICHPMELERLGKLEMKEREQLFNLLWSRKESWLKCIGIGIRCDLRRINLLEADSGRIESPEEDILWANDKKEALGLSKAHWKFPGLQNERFTLAACSIDMDASGEASQTDKGRMKIEIEKMEWQDLLE